MRYFSLFLLIISFSVAVILQTMHVIFTSSGKYLIENGFKSNILTYDQRAALNVTTDLIKTNNGIKPRSDDKSEPNSLGNDAKMDNYIHEYDHILLRQEQGESYVNSSNWYLPEDCGIKSYGSTQSGGKVFRIFPNTSTQDIMAAINTDEDMNNLFYRVGIERELKNSIRGVCKRGM